MMFNSQTQESRLSNTALLGAAFGVALTMLLLVRAGLDGRLESTLPLAQPAYARLLTAVVVGLAGGATAGLLSNGQRAIVAAAAAPFAAYLAWAIVRQNLLLNPDIWKLWQRGWLADALACSLAGLLFAFLFTALRNRP